MIKTKKLKWIVFCLVGVVMLFMAVSKIQSHLETIKAEKIKAAALKEAAEKHAKTPVVFKEGEHYERIKKEIMSQKIIEAFQAKNPNEIQVIEFFNYGCFWCSRLHPILDAWAAKKPADVAFYSFPIVFNKPWENLAKTYLVLKALGQEKKLDLSVFETLHKKRIDLSNAEQLKTFLKKEGVSETDFFNLYDSFKITSELTQAVNLANAYHIAFSPVVIINMPNGEGYLLTAKAAGNEEAMIKLLNELIAASKKASAESL